MLTESWRIPIGRRAWIGDGRHGASVAPDGTLDWYCPSGLTGPPGLWRLLDGEGPAVRVGPVRDGSGAHRSLPVADLAYRPGTNVVENVMEGAAGRRVSVVDLMEWAGPGHDGPGRVVRLVRALTGPVEIEVEVLTGRRRPGARPGAPGSVTVSGGRLVAGRIAVSGPGEFRPAPLGPDDERWRAVVVLAPGEETVVTVSAAPTGADPVATVGVDEAHRILAGTEAAWRSWLAPLVHSGPYRGAVERALLGVRALTGPGGAPAGAGTTSLPRRVGSERTSDSRWVHLRDVTTAVRTLAALGLAEDAEAAETWLRHTLDTAHLPWPSWFDADGQPVPGAEELAMEGWRRSAPVRSGRDPGRLDLGLAGEAALTVGAATSGPGGRPGDPGPLSAAFPALAEATDWAADRWRDPDCGRWEIERPRRCYVAGRIEVWSALSRMATLARAANPLDLQAVAWHQESRPLLAWLEDGALASDGGLRMDGPGPDGTGGTAEADAALLAVAWRGPWPATHPVVTATVGRILERLGAGPLLHRYSDRVADEQAGPDHPDLEASLMAVRALGHLGRWEDAHERMEAVVSLIGRAGPGACAAAADPVSGEMFGDFPCTAAALALADAAETLARGPR